MREAMGAYSRCGSYRKMRRMQGDWWGASACDGNDEDASAYNDRGD